MESGEWRGRGVLFCVYIPSSRSGSLTSCTSRVVQAFVQCLSVGSEGSQSRSSSPCLARETTVWDRVSKLRSVFRPADRRLFVLFYWGWTGEWDALGGKTWETDCDGAAERLAGSLRPGIARACFDGRAVVVLELGSHGLFFFELLASCLRLSSRRLWSSMTNKSRCPRTMLCQGATGSLLWSVDMLHSGRKAMAAPY